MISDSKLFLANDVAELREFLERFVPRKSKKDVIFLIENGRLRPADELVVRVSSMLDGNEEFDLIDEQNEAFQNIRHQLFDRKNLKRAHAVSLWWRVVRARENRSSQSGCWPKS